MPALFTALSKGIIKAANADWALPVGDS